MFFRILFRAMKILRTFVQFMKFFSQFEEFLRIIEIAFWNFSVPPRFFVILFRTLGVLRTSVKFMRLFLGFEIFLMIIEITTSHFMVPSCVMGFSSEVFDSQRLPSGLWDSFLDFLKSIACELKWVRLMCVIGGQLFLLKYAYNLFYHFLLKISISNFYSKTFWTYWSVGEYFRIIKRTILKNVFLIRFSKSFSGRKLSGDES